MVKVDATLFYPEKPQFYDALMAKKEPTEWWV